MGPSEEWIAHIAETEHRTICPAASTVANVKPPALLILPATLPSTAHSCRARPLNAPRPLHAISIAHRSLPAQFATQSYVPAYTSTSSADGCRWSLLLKKAAFTPGLRSAHAGAVIYRIRGTEEVNDMMI